MKSVLFVVSFKVLKIFRKIKMTGDSSRSYTSLTQEFYFYNFCINKSTTQDKHENNIRNCLKSLDKTEYLFAAI